MNTSFESPPNKEDHCNNIRVSFKLVKPFTVLLPNHTHAKHMIFRSQAVNTKDADWLVGGRVESSPPVHRSELLQYGHIPSEVDKARVHLSEKVRKTRIT